MGSSSRPQSPETQLSGQLNKKKKDNNKHLLSFRPAERKSDTLFFRCREPGAVCFSSASCCPLSEDESGAAQTFRGRDRHTWFPQCLFLAHCFQTGQDQLSASATVHFEAFPHCAWGTAHHPCAGRLSSGGAAQSGGR